MKSLLNKYRTECRDFRMKLEDAASAAPHAKELSELLAAMPVAQSGHAGTCVDCRAAVENMLAARTLLAGFPSNAELGGPWFASRVMAAIAARKAELSRAGDALTFLPKLAARLTWASVVALLLASTWLYQKPASPPSTPVATDITGEPLADNATPANNDEVLISLAESDRNDR